MTSINTHEAKHIDIRSKMETRAHDDSTYEVLEITITDADDKETLSVAVFSDRGRLSITYNSATEKSSVSDE